MAAVRPGMHSLGTEHLPDRLGKGRRHHCQHRVLTMPAAVVNPIFLPHCFTGLPDPVRIVPIPAVTTSPATKCRGMHQQSVH